MSIKQWPAAKDPDEVKDFVVNWTERLGADTIASTAWAIVDHDHEEVATLVVDSNSYSNAATVDGEADQKITTLWLSAGTAGWYRLRNRITTAGGRIYDQTIKLEVRPQ